MSIASEISRLQTAKSDLKTAIEGQGVTVPSSTKLDGYAALVDSISSGVDGDNLSYGVHELAIVGAIVGTATLAPEYDAEVYWDYENWEGSIISGTYSDLYDIIDGGDTPKILVTVQYDGSSDARLATNIEVLESTNIFFFAGEYSLSAFEWTSNDVFSCID